MNHSTFFLFSHFSTSNSNEECGRNLGRMFWYAQPTNAGVAMARRAPSKLIVVGERCGSAGSVG